MLNVDYELIDQKIVGSLESKIEEDANHLDFIHENTKEYTHCYHGYPAMMIPHLARELIEVTLQNVEGIKNVLDPFMGSGTTLVEGMLQGLEVHGNDINPLSELMSKVKTQPYEPSFLSEEIDTLLGEIASMYKIYIAGDYKVSNYPTFDRIDFWFKESVIKELQLIKNIISETKDGILKMFFMAAFSETVRYVSNTRNNEFKLYRMSAEDLAEWNPDVVSTFKKFLKRNEKGNSEFYEELLKVSNLTKPIITRGSSVNLAKPNNSIDFLVTSPPYGDSQTTVAYGQYSRLSLQWLDLEIDESTKLNQLDNIMLGGKLDRELEITQVLENLGSPALQSIYFSVKEKDLKRANQVLQFYFDLDKTLAEISRVMKKNSYQFWVVANRRVKGIELPTDEIIAELYRKYNVKEIKRFYRNISGKRMPSRNSPTNKKGKTVSTMNKEIILLLRKF